MNNQVNQYQEDNAIDQFDVNADNHQLDHELYQEVEINENHGNIDQDTNSQNDLINNGDGNHHEENQNKNNRGDQQRKNMESPEPFTKESDQKGNNNQFSTPNQNFATIDTERAIPSTQEKTSKKSNSRLEAQQTKQNFIEINRNVKTMKQLQQEFSQKKQTQRRLSVSSSTKDISTFNNLRKSIGDRDNRQHEWKKLLLNNDILALTKTTYTSQKNQSKEFVVKHIEIDIDELKSMRNSVGPGFTTNKKEKSYMMTNGSQINTMPSIKALDIPEVVEDKEFPTTKGNQTLKRSVNQSQVFSYKNKYLEDDDVPEGFESHRPKKDVVHNVNNVNVQSMRLRTLSSKVF